MDIPLCRHIKTSGEQCLSPRLRGQHFCYFHQRLRATHRATLRASPEHPIYNTEGVFLGNGSTPEPIPDLGPLEDRAAIQVAISTVVNALATRALDTKRATALLYGLQLASSNAPQQIGEFNSWEYALDDVALTPEGECIAPDDDPKALSHPK